MTAPLEYRAVGGPNGDQLVGGVASELRYLSRLCGQLHVPDPVERYLSPVLGRWSDLHDEAARWRAAAEEVGAVHADVHRPLAALDASWRGRDAEAFQAYLRTVGAAGTDLATAMTTMAAVLDKLADTLRSIVTRMTEVLARCADDASRAMAMPGRSTGQVRRHLQDVSRPTAELYEAARQTLTAFTKLCAALHGGTASAPATLDHRKHGGRQHGAHAGADPGANPGRDRNAVPGGDGTPSPEAAAAGGVGPTAGVASPNGSAVPGDAGDLRDLGDLGDVDTAADPSAADPGDAADVGDLGQDLGHDPDPDFGGPGGGFASVGGGGGFASGGLDGVGGGAGVEMGSAVAAGSVPEADVVGPGGQAGEMAPPGAFSDAADPPRGTGGSAAPGLAPAGRGGEAGGMPLLPMGPMGGGGRGGHQEHKKKQALTGDPLDIFGLPERTTQPVIGEDEDERPQPPEPEPGLPDRDLSV